MFLVNKAVAFPGNTQNPSDSYLSAVFSPFFIYYNLVKSFGKYFFKIFSYFFTLFLPLRCASFSFTLSRFSLSYLLSFPPIYSPVNFNQIHSPIVLPPVRTILIFSGVFTILNLLLWWNALGWATSCPCSKSHSIKIPSNVVYILHSTEKGLF